MSLLLKWCFVDDLHVNVASLFTNVCVTAATIVDTNATLQANVTSLSTDACTTAAVATNVHTTLVVDATDANIVTIPEISPAVIAVPHTDVFNVFFIFQTSNFV